MLTLDSTTASLEVILAGAITTNQLPIVSSFADKTTTTFTPGKTTTATNSTSTVTIVAAPGASTQREVHSINVYNADTVAATITIRENDNATLRILVKITLAVGDTLAYSHANLWRVTDTNGNLKSTFSGAILAATAGGTGFGAFTIGDILYANTATSLALLNDVATGNALISGGVGVAPSWGKIGLTTHVSGTLPVANGGTGATTLTIHGVLLGQTTGAIVATAAMTDGQLLVGQTGADPLTQTVSGYGTMAASGALTVTKTKGTATNDNATAGDVGEFVSASVSTPGSSLSNNTVTNVTSISLTAGDWDVCGQVVFSPAGSTTATVYIGSINTVSATLGNTTGTTSSQTVFVAGFLAGGTNCVVVNPCRISIASTTTVYLIAYSTFAVSTMSVAGVITARRMR